LLSQRFFILLDLFLAKLSLGDAVMIKSFGLAGVYLFGIVITIFLGASIIYKEIERRTFYFIFSKPVSYWDVVMGKFLGLFGALLITTLLMAAVYAGVVMYEVGEFDYLGLLAIFYQLLETALLVAFLIFFSTIATPLAATISTILLLFVGHFLSTALENSQRMGELAQILVTSMYYILPNLEKFNIRNMVVHATTPSLTLVVLTVVYTTLYCVIFLALAHLFLKKKEL